MSHHIVFSYFPNLNYKQKEQFKNLLPLYKEWNEQINVISRKDINELYIRHVLHSLAIAKVIELKSGTSVLDVGTGGGFPGIPLAILFPEVSFTLVDSIGKKIKVVEEVVAALDLKNVKALHQRAEKVEGHFDFVVSRAVAPTKTIYQWVVNKISSKSQNTLPNGLILLKGGDLSEELKEAKKPYQEYKIVDFFTEEFFETKKIIYIPTLSRKN